MRAVLQFVMGAECCCNTMLGYGASIINVCVYVPTFYLYQHLMSTHKHLYRTLPTEKAHNIIKTKYLINE